MRKLRGLQVRVKEAVGGAVNRDEGTASHAGAGAEGVGSKKKLTCECAHVGEVVASGVGHGDKAREQTAAWRYSASSAEAAGSRHRR